MSAPATREEFKNYCLRKLGSPVVQINVDDEQVEDRIDEALYFYQEHHYDGTERVLIQHQVTAQDKSNEYITLPDAVIGVSRVLDLGQSYQSSNLFNIRYQIHLNDLFDLSAASYVPYTMAMTHISNIEEIFVGKKPIDYNRHINRLKIYMDWQNDVAAGEYVIVDAYQITDPNVYASVWGDRWLQRYATALIKKQWGNNLKKYNGMRLPGGVDFNGQQIYDEADAEIKEIEENVINNYGGVVLDMIG